MKMVSTTQERNPTPTRRPTRGWIVTGALVVVLGVLVALAGVGVLRNDDRASFCDEIAGLPSLAGSAAEDGSPAGGFEHYAEVLDRAAEAAEAGNGVDEVGQAARTLAEHQRRVGAALAGTTSASDVAEAVSLIDPGPVEAATATLADAISARCH